MRRIVSLSLLCFLLLLAPLSSESTLLSGSDYLSRPLLEQYVLLVGFLNGEVATLMWVGAAFSHPELVKVIPYDYSVVEMHEDLLRYYKVHPELLALPWYKVMIGVLYEVALKQNPTSLKFGGLE